MLADYNYMPAYYACLGCPYASYGQYQESPYNEGKDVENADQMAKEEEENQMYRRPPFVPGPYFGPRPPFFGPFPPYFAPRPPVYGPYPPFYGPRPGFFGFPFLTGLALGGLLF